MLIYILLVPQSIQIVIEGEGLVRVGDWNRTDKNRFSEPELLQKLKNLNNFYRNRNLISS